MKNMLYCGLFFTFTSFFSLLQRVLKENKDPSANSNESEAGPSRSNGYTENSQLKRVVNSNDDSFQVTIRNPDRQDCVDNQVGNIVRSFKNLQVSAPPPVKKKPVFSFADSASDSDDSDWGIEETQLLPEPKRTVSKPLAEQPKSNETEAYKLTSEDKPRSNSVQPKLDTRPPKSASSAPKSETLAQSVPVVQQPQPQTETRSVSITPRPRPETAPQAVASIRGTVPERTLLATGESDTVDRVQRNNESDIQTPSSSVNHAGNSKLANSSTQVTQHLNETEKVNAFNYSLFFRFFK